MNINLARLYNKRKFYLKKFSYGKNNKGSITSRSRQSSIFKFKYSINYNYLFINLVYNEFMSTRGVYAKIINIFKCVQYNKYLYKIVFLNGVLKKNIEYIYSPDKRNLGDIIVYGIKASLNDGNILPIYKIPVGSYIHNLENIPTKGCVFVKNSKKSAFLISKGDKYVTVKLPSGEIRLLSKFVLCVLGILNLKQVNNRYYKAGERRLMGKRPIVRGTAKNACDHPHGGGEGKTSIGRKSCLSLWGVLFKGKKTRLKKKYSTKYIIQNK